MENSVDWSRFGTTARARYRMRTCFGPHPDLFCQYFRTILGLPNRVFGQVLFHYRFFIAPRRTLSLQQLRFF
jgi:hypothetical protein